MLPFLTKIAFPITVTFSIINGLVKLIKCCICTVVGDVQGYSRDSTLRIFLKVKLAKITLR